MSSDLVFLFTIGHFVDHPIAGLLHIVVGRFIDCPTDRVGLRFLNCFVDRSLACLPLDSLSRVATGLLARCWRATAVSRGTAITSGENGSR